MKKLATVLAFFLVMGRVARADGDLPPYLECTSRDGFYAVLVDWPTNGPAVYSVYETQGRRKPSEIASNPPLWTIAWRSRNHYPRHMAVSDDGRRVVLTTADAHSREQNRLEFWEPGGLCRPVTLSLPETAADVSGGVRYTSVSIAGNAVIVSNFVYSSVTRSRLHVSRYRDVREIELDLFDAKEKDIKLPPDRTEYSVCLGGRWRPLDPGAIAMSTAILLAVLAVLAFGIRRMKKRGARLTRE